MARARRRFLGPLVLLASLVSLTPGAGRGQAACTPTRPDAEGPFYVAGAPARSRTGDGFVVTGAVRSAAGCGPLGGARVEWWSADARGEYAGALRATQAADATGRYRYETVFPGRYPGRPPHLHVRVTAPRHQVLVTQLYPRPGQTALDVDFVLVPE